MNTRCKLRAFLVALSIAVPSADTAAQYLYWREVDQNLGVVIRRSALDGTGVVQIMSDPRPTPNPQAVNLDIDRVNGWLYWADRAAGIIRRTDLSGCTLQDVIVGLTDPQYVAVDASNGWIYWSQHEFNPPEDRGLWRARLDGSQMEQLDASDVFALTLDVDGGKIYVTNGTAEAGPSRANLDGTAPETLIDALTMHNTFGTTLQMSIALDTLNGDMYFGAGMIFFDPASIGRATLDGANPEQVVVDAMIGVPVGGPTDLVLDVPNNRMYWTNILARSIYSAALDGSDVQLHYAAIDGLTPAGLVLGDITVPGECPELCPPHLVEGDRTKSRYLTMVPGNAGVIVGIRVTLADVADFPGHNGRELWVGPPQQYPEEDTSEPGGTFTGASLQCDPHFQDWGTIDVLQVFGAEVVPGSAYDVHAVHIDCWPVLVPGLSVGPPLASVTGRFGDVAPLFEGDDPAAPQPDFNDIAATVQKFLAAPGAPIKAMAQLQPNVVFPDRSIDFKDIAADVSAFVEVPYASMFAGPCTCPSGVTCGATPCAGDTECSGGFCIDGFCTDACGRCRP